MCCGKMTSAKGMIFKLACSGKLEKSWIVRQDKLELHSILFQTQWMQNRMPKSLQPTLAIVPRTAGTMKKAADSYNCFSAFAFIALNICTKSGTNAPLNVLRSPSNILKRELYAFSIIHTASQFPRCLIDSAFHPLKVLAAYTGRCSIPFVWTPKLHYSQISRPARCLGLTD
jgi:hypothetical protein